ncbi:hypothetical protein [Streptomyces ardesiacus]|uniref:hypothetical protein n=1 Tax=Streptomyces ardesiacus TaxID=285564 RepID=UPI003644E7E7
MGRELTWWLNAILPDCYVDGSGRSGISGEALDRKTLADYAHAHADHRIRTHVTEWDRTDAILALKRAMQLRVDHLDAIYKFNQFPEFRQLGPLGLLEHWGIIRQRMLRRMRQLRNAVEHEGVEPPNLEECEDYAEVVWWFLRGTSPILMPLDNMDFGGAFDGSVTYSYNPLKIKVSGDVEAALISNEEHEGWTKLSMAPAYYGDVKGKMTPVEVNGGRYRIEATVTDLRTAQFLMQKAFSYVL